MSPANRRQEIKDIRQAKMWSAKNRPPGSRGNSLSWESQGPFIVYPEGRLSCHFTSASRNLLSQTAPNSTPCTNRALPHLIREYIAAPHADGKKRRLRTKFCRRKITTCMRQGWDQFNGACQRMRATKLTSYLCV